MVENESLDKGRKLKDRMRIRKFKTILLLLASAILFGGSDGVAFAQKEPKKPVEVSDVDIADSDSDGTVTTEELKEFLKGQYFEAWAQKIDANQDGTISNEEFLLTQKAHEELLADGSFAIVSKGNAVKKTEASKTAVQLMNQRFLDKNPLIGSTVEELYAYDEDGEEVDFEDLRGKHVVIVFGCLT